MTAQRQPEEEPDIVVEMTYLVRGIPLRLKLNEQRLEEFELGEFVLPFSYSSEHYTRF